MAVSSIRRAVHLKPGAAALFLALVGCLLPGALSAAAANGEGIAVRAVLFYSPNCPHCHQVMTEDLPPLLSKYGSQLQILTVDIDDPRGADLYDAAVKYFQLPMERTGVPTLVVGDVVLVGSAEIAEQLPSLVDRVLARGGSDWPSIPGLADVLPPETASPSSGPLPASAPAGSFLSNVAERIARDPVGNALAIAVLLGLLASLAWAATVVWGARATRSAGPPSGWIPILALVGLGVAAYLASVETTGASAVCGPVGDCNRVQQSEYARLLGVVHIGLLGCAGYVSILGAWFAGRVATGTSAQLARLSLIAMTGAGVLFSIYLTFLEPFVIGATCAWCLTSAVLMDALLLLSVASMRTRDAERET
jgi:uncharacterized membrane protein/glutaredoxin